MSTYVRFKYMWRWTGLKIVPATVVGADTPGGTKGEPTRLSQRWQAAVQLLNPEHANYILKNGSGWVNAMPNAEKVAFAGNVGMGLAHEDGCWLVDALRLDDPIPDPGDILQVHRFTCVDALGRPRQPGSGFDAWVYLLSNGPMWVKESTVDVFSAQPDPVWPGGAPPDLGGYAAVVLKGTVVRQSPAGVKIFVLAQDTVYRVISEVNGWAKIGDKRWVELGRVRPVG